MTNAGESVGIFVPPNMPSNIDVANYVQNLFPTISPQVAAAAAAQYEGLGSNPQQITSLYTEGQICFHQSKHLIIDLGNSHLLLSHIRLVEAARWQRL